MKKIVLSVLIFFIFLLSGCFAVDFTLDGNNLEKIPEGSDGIIIVDGNEYVPVNVPGLCALRIDGNPIGYINGVVGNVESDNKNNRIFNVKNSNGKWLNAHQYGLMMNWDNLYKLESIADFDLSEFGADKLQLSKGNLPSVFHDSDIAEIIDDIDVINEVLERILTDELIPFEGKTLIHIRSIFILSSEYPGVGFLYSLQRDKEGNTYIGSLSDWGGYNVSDIFGYIKK